MHSDASPKTAINYDSLGLECNNLGYSLYIWLSPDRLECRLSYIPHDIGDMLTREELMTFLDQHSIIEGLLEDAVDEFMLKAQKKWSITRELVAYGIEPVNGSDGKLDYIATPSTSLIKNKKNIPSAHADTVDFHIVQTFINVLPGDEIARISNPEEGIPGLSVTGHEIAAKPGKPSPLRIGNNIEVIEEETEKVLRARTAGRVCEVHGEINVFQEYIVSGDVNFRVGSITFNGFVEVRGDILDEFTVDASKGLMVFGNIGNSTITSDGDVAFCGMDGGSRGTIRCGGSIKANFIHDADIECVGDIEVDVEIHNSRIRTLGKVLVNKGAITGGTCTALGGIQTYKAGSGLSVKTFLSAGIDFRDEEQLDNLIAELEKNIEISKHAKSLEQLEVLKDEREFLAGKLDKISCTVTGHYNSKINIRKILYDNTYVRLGKSPRIKMNEKAGPLSLIENSIDGGVRYLDLTGLDVNAQDLEWEIVAIHETKKQIS